MDHKETSRTLPACKSRSPGPGEGGQGNPDRVVMSIAVQIEEEGILTP